MVRLDNQAMFRSSQLLVNILCFYLSGLTVQYDGAEAVLPHAKLHPANSYHDNKNMPQVKMHQDTQNIISLQEAPR